MRKIIAMFAIMVLCAGSSFAVKFPGLQNEVPDELSNSTFSTSQSTPVATAAELKYIILETTGTNSGGTLTVRDNATDKLSVSIGTSAGSVIIDLSELNVLFKTNINLSANVTNAGISYTLIYRDVN